MRGHYTAILLRSRYPPQHLSKMFALSSSPGCLTALRQTGTDPCGRRLLRCGRTFPVVSAQMGATEGLSLSRRYVLSAGMIASSLLLGTTAGEAFHPALENFHVSIESVSKPLFDALSPILPQCRGCGRTGQCLRFQRDAV